MTTESQTKPVTERKAPVAADHAAAVRKAADDLAAAIAAAREAGYHVDFRDAALTRIAVSETRRTKR